MTKTQIKPIVTDFMEDLKSLTEKEVITQTVSHRAFLDFFNTMLILLGDAKFAEHHEKLGHIRSELIEQLRASGNCRTYLFINFKKTD